MPPYSPPIFAVYRSEGLIGDALRQNQCTVCFQLGCIGKHTGKATWLKVMFPCVHNRRRPEHSKDIASCMSCDVMVCVV